MQNVKSFFSKSHYPKGTCKSEDESKSLLRGELFSLVFTIFTEEIWMTNSVENHGRIYLYIALAGDGGYFRCNEYRELGCNYCGKRV